MVDKIKYSYIIKYFLNKNYLVLACDNNFQTSYNN